MMGLFRNIIYRNLPLGSVLFPVSLLTNETKIYTHFTQYSGTSISRTSRETKKYSSYRKFELWKYIFFSCLSVEFTSGLCPLARKTWRRSSGFLFTEHLKLNRNNFFSSELQKIRFAEIRVMEESSTYREKNLIGKNFLLRVIENSSCRNSSYGRNIT
jgi:hypothetical protein